MPLAHLGRRVGQGQTHTHIHRHTQRFSLSLSLFLGRKLSMCEENYQYWGEKLETADQGLHIHQHIEMQEKAGVRQMTHNSS